MDQVVFGDYTLKDVAIVVGVVIVAIVLLTFIARMFRGKVAEAQFEKVRCKCGWTGQASRFAGRCPRCNTPLGQRRSQPPPGGRT